MRIEFPHRFERFGSVRIHGIQQVVELDSGSDRQEHRLPQGQMVVNVPTDEISQIESRMAIVIPCKAERLKVIGGVLSGIPHNCPIILVSNSDRSPVDRYEMESDTVERFCHLSERSAVLVHQRDPGLGRAFQEAGFPEILAEDGLVRNGKGEGMMVGIAFAYLSGADFVGFIDADNYIPGAVHEYVKAYASGFHLARTPFSMVRISWHSKPKIQDGKLFFNRWGRTSQVTNRFLNLLLAEYSGFGTDLITTGNAGEHALSLDLALRMQFAAGFSVEPYEYLNLFEKFGGVVPATHPEVMQPGVDIFQIETRNPHFHEDKGADHVQEMRLQALNVLYHSPICPEGVRAEIVSFLSEQGVLDPGAEPPVETIYPPLGDVDWRTFLEVLADKSETFEQIQRTLVSRIVSEPAIRMPVTSAGLAEPADPAAE